MQRFCALVLISYDILLVRIIEFIYALNIHLVTARLIVIIPFFIIGLTSEIYGVSVDGLKLDRLNEKVELHPPNVEMIECKNLNELLQSATFLETTHEEVSVELSDEVSHESLVNTDGDLCMVNLRIRAHFNSFMLLTIA